MTSQIKLLIFIKIYAIMCVLKEKQKYFYCQNIQQNDKKYRQKTQTFYIKYRQNTHKRIDFALRICYNRRA